MPFRKVSGEHISKAINNDKITEEYLGSSINRNEETYLFHKSDLTSNKLTVFSLTNLDPWLRGQEDDVACVPMMEASKKRFWSKYFVAAKRTRVSEEGVLITRKKHNYYRKYEIIGSEHEVVVMLDHKLLPITDFKYKDSCYRWVFFNSKLVDGKYSFKYVLYKLDKDQHTLFDNNENEINRGEVSKAGQNPLLSNTINRFKSFDDRMFSSKYMPKDSPMRLAEFEHNLNDNYHKDLRASSYLKIFKKNRNSNSELLQNDELVIYLALVFKYVQDHKLSKKKYLNELRYTSEMGVPALF
ncbi:uncharacterized protein RJT20DRAFT_11658 [Scheffersomyces xylosifermentans]|uniref:uncharacterized protein n=1 Tax=Scheffersomyces xylosifermentans TaxID=1304137 RepID=UPI00315D804C